MNDSLIPPICRSFVTEPRPSELKHLILPDNPPLPPIARLCQKAKTCGYSKGRGLARSASQNPRITLVLRLLVNAFIIFITVRKPPIKNKYITPLIIIVNNRHGFHTPAFNTDLIRSSVLNLFPRRRNKVM